MKAPELLLDTHIVIWMAVDPDRISLSLLAAIQKAEKRFVSHITALEVQLKHLKHGPAFGFSLDDLEAAMKEFSCTALPLSYRDIAEIGELTFSHQDPFDRLLMAQAATRELTLVTLDERIISISRSSGKFTILNTVQ